MHYEYGSIVHKLQAERLAVAKKRLAAEDKSNALLDELRLLPRNAPWHALATTVRQSQAYAADSYAVKRAIQEFTGLSGRVLTRYFKILESVETAAAAAGVSPDDLLSNDLDAMEVATRLHDRSPQLGIIAMRGLRQGLITVSEVSDRLVRIPFNPADANIVQAPRQKSRG